MYLTAKKAARAAATLRDPRWSAVLARDASQDGLFVFAVVTTGVYCKPSCTSRRPRPENVRFHASCREAEEAGFRPCRRCRPELPVHQARHADRIVEACRLIEAAETAPTLEALAQQVGLSRFHFHRLFKAHTGLTPKAYADAQRARRARARLEQNASVTSAMQDAGFASSGRFYSRSSELFGMTPGHYRAGGSKRHIVYALGACVLGSILVARSERGLCAILLGDEPESLRQALLERFSQAEEVAEDARFAELLAQVIAFVEAPQIGLDLPLDVRGTVFQQRVWRALQQIPPGRLVSYAQIAERIGKPGSVRAVANACAANMLAVAIPCHRVVRSDGELSGYRWGIERKRSLIEREAAAGDGSEPQGQAAQSQPTSR